MGSWMVLKNHAKQWGPGSFLLWPIREKTPVSKNHKITMLLYPLKVNDFIDTQNMTNILLLKQGVNNAQNQENEEWPAEFAKIEYEKRKQQLQDWMVCSPDNNK